ncbi:esterase-like activity of phytase family protein [Williamsia sp. SKLECPSW1]
MHITREPLLRRALMVAGTACLVATSACSSGSSAADDTLAADAGRPTTFSYEQILRATGGATPVRYAAPAHGTIRPASDGGITYIPTDGYTGTDRIVATTSAAVSLYPSDIGPLATVGGVPIGGSGYGSAFTPVPGTTDEFYGLTDRGPNVDGRTDTEKVLPLPDFHPAIGRFRLVDGRAELVSTITLTGPDGRPLNGRVDPRASTGETLVDLSGTALPTSDHGLDTEGLVALPDGTFWVSDEYGPFIVHLDSSGRESARLSPFDGSLPRELSLRTPNQGMEGLTITPDGTTLVGIMQSALRTPGLSGSAKSVPVTRIVTVDLRTRAVSEYLYPLANPQKTKVAVSEITALSGTRFLVDERDGKLEPGANKKLWIADISAATDVGPRSRVAGARYDAGAGGLLVGGRPIETVVGVTTDTAAVAHLRSMGITPASKTLDVDLGGLVTRLDPSGGFFGHDKVEGVAALDGGTRLAISNDSDFGLAGLASTTPRFTLRPKVLANGLQDSGEVLVLDTTQLSGTGRDTVPTAETDISVSVR